MPIDMDTFLNDSSLTSLHWEFGKMLARRGEVAEGSGDDAQAISLLGAKCLKAVEDGHSCLDLAAWKNATPSEEHPSDTSPLSVEEWEGMLARCPQLFSEEAGVCKPFYLDREHHLLYLQKYYLAETNIADFIRKHLSNCSEPHPM